jgi:hypothetical protein
MVDAGVDVQLGVTATPAQVSEVEAALQESPRVRSYRFVDQDEAYGELQRSLRIDPSLIDGIQPADLPRAFRVDLRGGRTAQRDFVQQLGARNLSGVRFISSVYEYCVLQGCRPRGTFAIVAFRQARHVRFPGTGDALKLLLLRDPAIRSTEDVDGTAICLTPNEDHPDEPNVVVVVLLRTKADRKAFLRRARALPTVRGVELRHAAR